MNRTRKAVYFVVAFIIGFLLVEVIQLILAGSAR